MLNIYYIRTVIISSRGDGYTEQTQRRRDSYWKLIGKQQKQQSHVELFMKEVDNV